MAQAPRLTTIRNGKKAAESAVSAKRSRSMFGMRKATLNASAAALWLAPNRWAKTISRKRPMTRLTAVPAVKERTPLAMSSMLRPLFDICDGDIKGYNRPMSFDDNAKPPDDAALAKALGKA